MTSMSNTPQAASSASGLRQGVVHVSVTVRYKYVITQGSFCLIIQILQGRKKGLLHKRQEADRPISKFRTAGTLPLDLIRGNLTLLSTSH